MPNTVAKMENLIFLALPLVFFLLWFSTMSLLFLVSSWRKMMQKYAYAFSVEGKVLNWASIVINNGIRYQRSVTITISPKGFYVLPMKFLQLAWHRPFLVPWSEVVGLYEKKNLFASYLEMKLKDGTTFGLENKVKVAMDELGIIIKQTNNGI